MFTFCKRYFLFACILFVIEVLIALCVHDDIIRPYIGGLLVVILLYCFVKSVISISVKKAAVSVLLFSFLIETGQYFHLISWLKLKDSTLAKAVLGNSFAWIALMMYASGICLVVIVEAYMRRTDSSMAKEL